MLYNYYIIKLLDMEQMAIRNIEVYPDRLIVCVETELRPTQCPPCMAEANNVNNYSKQTEKDYPAQGKRLICKYKKRRYTPMQRNLPSGAGCENSLHMLNPNY